MAYTYAGRFFEALFDTSSHLLISTAFSVFQLDGTTPATTYTDRTKTTTHTGVLTTDNLGNAEFYADPAFYMLKVGTNPAVKVEIKEDNAETLSLADVGTVVASPASVDQKVGDSAPVYGTETERQAIDPTTKPLGWQFVSWNGGQTEKLWVVGQNGGTGPHVWRPEAAAGHHNEQHRSVPHAGENIGVDPLYAVDVGAVPETTRNVAGGFAGLGLDGQLDASVLPATDTAAATDSAVVENEVALPASSTFTGAPHDALDSFTFTLMGRGDQAFSIKAQTSADLTSWADQASGSVSASSVAGALKGVITLPVVSRYVRLVVTNGSTNQGTLRVSSRFL